jgi:phage tail-like protein
MKRRTLLPVLVVGGLLAVAVVGAAFATSNRSLPGGGSGTDPLTAARFSIVIDGVEIAAFSELAGISSGVDATELINTSGDRTVRTLLPGKRAPDSVVLTRGLTSGLELQAWHDLVLDGDVAAARKSASLVMYSTDGTAVARYHFENAWPSKIETGQLKSGTATFVTETVTIVCDRIHRVAP